MATAPARRVHRYASLLPLIVLASGCSGSNSATAPTPTVSSLTINDPSSLFIVGTTATFTATAVLSNGSTTALSNPAWTSDAPTVATINSATGVLTPLKGGTTTIRLSANGLQASAAIEVVANLQGSWHGQYSVTSCSDSGALTTCGSLPEYPSDSGSLTLTLTQSGAAVQGTLLVGALPLSVSGSQAASGVLTLIGSGNSSGFSITLGAWASQVNGTQMTGNLTVSISVTSGPTGGVLFSALLSNVFGPS